MTFPQPIVLDVTNMQEFVRYVLQSHAPPSTLVVCAPRDEFVNALKQNLSSSPMNMDGLDNWLQTPTLRLLSTSRTLKIAFCPDITHLRAYLDMYSVVASHSGETDVALTRKDVQPILAILNPIELHRPTSAFSAQGLNRTLSGAIEAAHSTGSKLILAECSFLPEQITTSPMDAQPNPWDEELSILNATTKRLGDLAVGRTVKARTIAQRWCTFEQMPQSKSRE